MKLLYDVGDPNYAPQSALGSSKTTMINFKSSVKFSNFNISVPRTEGTQLGAHEYSSTWDLTFELPQP